MTGALMFIEAIHSVALSHRPGCRCDVCRAAGGDQAALERILIAAADRRIAADEHGGKG